jgi:hypothetical protein
MNFIHGVSSDFVEIQKELGISEMPAALLVLASVIEKKKLLTVDDGDVIAHGLLCAMREGNLSVSATAELEGCVTANLMVDSDTNPLPVIQS